MIITNTQNKIKKEVQINDIVNVNFDEYKIVGQTEKSWRLEYQGVNPNIKKNDTWNKNTFIKRFFFDGKCCVWTFVRTGSVPNFDYM